MNNIDSLTFNTFKELIRDYYREINGFEQGRFRDVSANGVHQYIYTSVNNESSELLQVTYSDLLPYRPKWTIAVSVVLDEFPPPEE